MLKMVILALSVCLIAIKGGGMELLVKAPSDVVVGEKFKVEVVPLDDEGNVIKDFSETVTLFIEGQVDKQEITMETFKVKKDSKVIFSFVRGETYISLNKEGWHQILITDGKNTTRFPVRCHKESPKYKIYWGEIHTHSSYCGDAAGGAFDPYKSYAWGRYVACLDFATIVAHHWSLNEKKWNSLAQITNEWNKPKEGFVTILGYEWGQGDVVGSRINHNNVYFLADEGPLAPNMKSVKDFWKFLDNNSKVPTIAIPHHPALKGIRTEWDTYNEKYQPVVEIFSQHGNSECEGALHQGVCNWKEGYVQNALEKGYILGFIAGSDNHGGRLGTNSKVGARGGGPRVGLAAIFAESLDRKGLWEGLKTRYCYGTTGAQRIIIDFQINGHRMGEVFMSSTGPKKIFIEVAGTTKIKKIEIIKNNKIFCEVEGKSWYEKIEKVDNSFQRGRDFYYVRVTQEDDNLAWSSPIWVK